MGAGGVTICGPDDAAGMGFGRAPDNGGIAPFKTTVGTVRGAGRPRVAVTMQGEAR